MPTRYRSLYSREALADCCAVNIRAYYSKDWQGYDMALHAHDQAEIMYVTSGRCAIKLAGGETALGKGGFILLDAGVPHGLKVAADAPCRIMNVEFTLERGDAAIPLRAAAERHPGLARFLREAKPVAVFHDTAGVHEALRRVINCLDDAGEGHAFELELYTVELLVAVASLREESADAGDAVVRRAAQFMNRNYYREIGVADVSRHAGVAAGTLSRLFRKGTGETVVGYLTALRIKKAKMLLGRTELPIVEISGYVGVPSREYFNALFKKHTGMTPGQYRRSCASEKSSPYPGCV